MKIFVDANIFVAACGSETGGSQYLFVVASQEPTWHLITSHLAVREARTNVQKKLPHALSTLEDLILVPSLTIVHPAPQAIVMESAQVIDEKDAPILAAAVCAQAQYLCTLDRKDFHNLKVKKWCKHQGITIVTPRDLLVQWRDSQRPARRRTY